MARPVKKRRICHVPHFCSFIPKDKPIQLKPVVLSLDEYECLRLIDYENLTQEECALQMNLTRTSVTAIYASARAKIADCLVNGRELKIEGGNIELCSGGRKCFLQNRDTQDCAKNEGEQQEHVRA